VAETTVESAGFQVPVYEARPAAAGRYPVVLVIPEIFGMHEHIKDVARRFAKEGFLALAFEPYAREGGVLQLPDQAAVMKVANSVPDAQVMTDLDALVTYVKEMEAALKAAGKTAEFLLYGDAPHAFHADYRPSYRAVAAKDAWARCVAWFNKYLKGEFAPPLQTRRAFRFTGRPVAFCLSSCR
jgi:dienelactone hydrolase